MAKSIIIAHPEHVTLFRMTPGLEELLRLLTVASKELAEKAKPSPDEPLLLEVAEIADEIYELDQTERLAVPVTSGTYAAVERDDLGGYLITVNDVVCHVPADQVDGHYVLISD